MASLSAIRTAVVDTLSQIDGLAVHPQVQEQINPPAALITPADAEFDKAFGRGEDEWHFDIVVVVSRQELLSAQDLLDQYVNGFGPKSIREHIWNNRDLGLDETFALITGVTGYGATYEFNSIQYLGAKLRLVVRTSGKD